MTFFFFFFFYQVTFNVVRVAVFLLENKSIPLPSSYPLKNVEDD